MWAIANGTQLWETLMAAALGVGLGVYYDVFRVIRLVAKAGAGGVFVQDLVFFGTSGLVTFLFALALNGGRLRFYLFLGLLAGFALYYFTLGRLVMAFARRVIDAVVRAWRFLWTVLLWPPRFLWRRVLRPAMRRLRRGLRRLARLCRLGNILRKFINILKKPLKNGRSVLYNKSNRLKRHGPK